MSTSLLREFIREAFINKTDPRMTGGRFEAEMNAKKKDPRVENIKKDIRFINGQIKKAKSGKLKGYQNIPAMEEAVVELEQKLAAL